MIIDSSFVPVQPQNIFMRLGRLGVGKSYRIFIHNRSLYGANVNLNKNNNSIVIKDVEKYAEFIGTTNEFLALDKNNFVIQSWDVSQILVDQKSNRKTGRLQNDGIIELQMKNGNNVTDHEF